MIEPPPASRIAGEEGLGQEDRCLEVEGQGAPDSVVGLVLGPDPGVEPGGVVDQDVDRSPELLEAGLGDGQDLVTIGQVGRERDEPAGGHGLLVEHGGPSGYRHHLGPGEDEGPARRVPIPALVPVTTAVFPSRLN